MTPFQYVAPEQPGGLQLSFECDPPELHVRLEGELDIMNAERLRVPPHHNLDALRNVMLDLGDLTFCDVTGLRALLRFRDEHVRGQRTVQVTRLHPNVLRLFVVGGLDNHLLTALSPPSSSEPTSGV